MSAATTSFPVTQVTASRISSVDFNQLSFGYTFTDHMFVAEYCNGTWQHARIEPYGPLMLTPATSALHYGQAIFEGMKAHKTGNGKIALFRPERNIARMNKSALRMSMPEIPESIFLEGLRQLIRLDSAWVPDSEGSALYIRPVMFGADNYIGVRTSERYLFVIMLSPVGPYYSAPVSVWVEERYCRAERGGVGNAKTAGNYGRTLMPVEEARRRGYKDILWLDGEQRKYVEEVGTMNVFFVIDDTICTPELDGCFLEGITRDSILTLAKEIGFKVAERHLAIEEVAQAYREGRLKEVFGTGTAAVITYVDRIGYRDLDMHLNVADYTISPKLKAGLEGIQKGNTESHGDWVVYV
jgi:branched-chain amino acid aminotransferase